MRWALPVTFASRLCYISLGFMRLVHDYYDHAIHYGVEIVFYATVGPVLGLTLTRPPVGGREGAS